MKNLTLENLVAVEKQQGVKVDFIGSLMWYTVSDCKITRDEIQDLMIESGISLNYLPRPINYRDAFRRATKVAETSKVQIEKGKYLNLLIREVKMDKEEIVRHMIREIVDSNNERLEYLPVIKFRLTGSFLTTEHLTGFLTDTELEQAEKVMENYEENKDHYEGTNMRLLVKTILHDCDPIIVRPSGGVYFTPKKHEDLVQATKNFINKLNRYNITKTSESQAWTIPVIDTAEQREMVSQSLETQVKNESDSLIKEMTDLLKSGKPFRQETAEGFVKRVRRLKTMVAEYEELLEFQAESANATLDIVFQQAMKLLETEF